MPPKKIQRCENEQRLPMDLPEAPTVPEMRYRPIHHPLWTENKAKLIERYLYYFVMITHHGTYIDGFAGPQEVDKPEMWAAKLVLDNEPKWMRHFHLYDLDTAKYTMLKQLTESQTKVDSKGRKVTRKVDIKCGDFNILVHQLLASQSIGQKEATFCLLDQRTFECKWSTIRALAAYKTGGQNKIEIFYFLPNSWQNRALAGLTANQHLASEWWGEEIDPDALRKLGAHKRRDIMCERFITELGYRYATPWAIYEKEKGRGSIMYYMIHATDHNEAPKLMERAYHHAVLPKEPFEQLQFLFPEMDDNLSE